MALHQDEASCSKVRQGLSYRCQRPTCWSQHYSRKLEWGMEPALKSRHSHITSRYYAGILHNILTTRPKLLPLLSDSHKHLISSYLVKHIKNSCNIICILAARIVILCPKATPIASAPGLSLILRASRVDPTAMGVPSALQIRGDARERSRPPGEMETGRVRTATG